MEREVGGGIGMGKTCKLKDVSFQCMTKFTTKKKINKNKKNKKKKEFPESETCPGQGSSSDVWLFDANLTST